MSESVTTMETNRLIRPSGRLALARTIALFLVFSQPARAQYIETYFPEGVPGYDTSLGTTVLSRERPEYQPQGIRAGSFTVRPALDESFGFDSNPNASNTGSSIFLRTMPAISINSDWSRNALGISLTAENYAYFDKPAQDFTNWTASIGGGYTIGRSNLTLAYSHLSLNTNQSQVGEVQSTTPIHFSVNDVRSDYTFDLGRISVTPNIDVQNYTFDNATILGQTVSQTFRNRVVVTGGVTSRYNLSEQRNLVVVVQGVESNFTDQPPEQPSNDSTSVLALGGIDYEAGGPWQYRLLAGVEQRSFTASQYKTRTAPIIQGQVIWTPTGLTTVTGSIARTIEAPSSAGNSGFTFTTAQIGVDHELYRNIILQAAASVQTAEYLQGGGRQTSYTLGTGATWLVNRNVRLSFSYNFTQQTAGQTTTVTGVPIITTTNSLASVRNVVLMAVHLAL